jgi:hypothetical protein
MTANAVRLRRYRERRAAGRAMIQIEINWLDLTDLLVRSGLLEQWDADDRAAVEKATERLLEIAAKE